MTTPPTLPVPPTNYSAQYMGQLLHTLRTYFYRLSVPQELTAAKLHIDVGTLPTEADLADLRAGTVYRDTSAGNALKVKT